MEKIDNYTLLSLLNQGTLSKYYLTSKEGTETKYVTQVIEKSKAEGETKRYIDNEISILLDIDHPNIIKLFEVKKTEKFIYVITEYCNGGDLQSFLDKYVEENNKGLPEEIVQYLMKQIIEAFKYLHNKRILHRNIKLENILINYEDENDKLNNNIMKAKIKIIDFEFSKYLEKGKLTYTTLGSPSYMSPLLLYKLNSSKNNKNKGYDEKEEIWSLGIIFYELLVGKNPFEAEDMAELVEKVEKGIYKIPSNISKEAVSFMNGMIQYDSNKRLTIDELSCHNFLNKKCKDFIENEIEINFKKTDKDTEDKDKELYETDQLDTKIDSRKIDLPMKIDDYVLLRLLDQGSFCNIYLTSKEGKDIIPNIEEIETKFSTLELKDKIYATKLIDKKNNNEDLKRYFDNEISILKEINHPNIIKLIDVKENSNYIFIILEYCNGGNLQSFLDKYVKENNKGLPEEIVQYLMKQIIEAFKYLHNKGIMHRDIKLENILINYANENDKKNNNIMRATIKLIDFFFSKRLKKGELTYTTIGNPINMSPIILKKLYGNTNTRKVGYGIKEDIWSLGSIFYTLLIGKSPFDAEDMDELVENIEKGIYKIPSTLSKEAVSFMNSMLQYDSEKRLNIDELSGHKFLQKNIKEFGKIDTNEIKDLVKGSDIEINTKSNDSIWKVVGH